MHLLACLCHETADSHHTCTHTYTRVHRHIHTYAHAHPRAAPSNSHTWCSPRAIPLRANIENKEGSSRVVNPFAFSISFIVVWVYNSVSHRKIENRNASSKGLHSPECLLYSFNLSGNRMCLEIFFIKCIKVFFFLILYSHCPPPPYSWTDTFS